MKETKLPFRSRREERRSFVRRWEFRKWRHRVRLFSRYPVSVISLRFSFFDETTDHFVRNPHGGLISKNSNRVAAVSQSSVSLTDHRKVPVCFGRASAGLGPPAVTFLVGSASRVAAWDATTGFHLDRLVVLVSHDLGRADLASVPGPDVPMDDPEPVFSA